MIKLNDSEIHLWFVDHQDFDEVELKNECLSWLSEEELDRLNRYIFRRHQKQFLLGRMLIRRALSQYSDVSPQHWRLADNQYGKLFLEPSHKESLFFNLSHAGDRLVLAISRVDQLGVDIEASDKLRKIVKIAKRHFSISEVEELISLPDSQQLSRFYELWTLKEAYIKARGFGLVIPLNQLTFAFSEDRLIFHFSREIEDDPLAWQIWQIYTPASYKLALALRNEREITSINSYRFMTVNDWVSEKTSIIRKSDS